MFLLLLICISILWLAQTLIFQQIWDKNISVQLKFADDHIYQGDSSILKETVVNDKHVPLPALQVRLIIPRELRFNDEVKDNTSVSDQTYKRDIFSFAGRQQITRSLGFICDHRGYYQLKSVDLMASDFFFFKSRYQSIPQDAALYVFPRQISVDRINLLCREISGSIVVQNRLHPDPFTFSGIRDYEKTDPMNHINWKASARMGNLMVNQFDSTTNINVTILLDASDSHILSREKLVEEGICIASSLAGKMAGRKMPVRVCSNARMNNDSRDHLIEQNVRVARTDWGLMEISADSTGENEQNLDMFLPAGGSQLLELNQYLACIDRKDMAFSAGTMLERISQEKVSGHTYVLVSEDCSEDMQKKAAMLTAGNNQVIWVCPQYEDEDSRRISIPFVNFLRWEVLR